MPLILPVIRICMVTPNDTNIKHVLIIGYYISICHEPQIKLYHPVITYGNMFLPEGWPMVFSIPIGTVPHRPPTGSRQWVPGNPARWCTPFPASWGTICLWMFMVISLLQNVDMLNQKTVCLSENEVTQQKIMCLWPFRGGHPFFQNNPDVILLVVYSHIPPCKSHFYPFLKHTRTHRNHMKSSYCWWHPQ